MRWKSVIVCAITFAFLLGCVTNAPIQKKGTSIRKMATFLLNFGYIELNDPDNNRGAFDLNSPEFQASIRSLQRFGNIPVTGRMDAATISLINTDRCGVKDPQNKAAVGRFKLQGSRWKKRLLTYRIVNFTKDGIPNYVQRRIFSNALRLWESVAGIEIRECSQCRDADILISFVTRKHGDYYPFDGEGGTLAHAFYPLTNKDLSGDAHFDDDERFTTGRSDGINLDWVAVHEFGHSLGLEHSNVRESIMYPWYKGYVPNIELTSDDIKGIQALYGPSSTVPPTVTTTRPPTPPAPSFCNFDESMCGFVQSKNDKFDWTRNKGGTSSSSTGPSADASGSRKGYYMYIETSSPRVQGDNAKLDSPPYRFSGNICLKFYYHMYGATIGRLNVSINGKTVFSESDNKGNKWFYTEITVSSFSGMYTITFEGVRGSSFTGDIAIDDFSLTPGSCSPKPTVRQLTTPIRSTRRPRVTPRFTKRPRVTTSPTSHPRVTTPPVPSLCDTSIRYDTVFVGLDGWTYFFVGERFWKINRRLRRRGPRPITSQWSEIETPVDAAYVNGQRHVVFFKGSKFWEYDSKRKLLKSGPIAQYGNGGFPADSAALDNMDAVFTWEGNGRTYFFKDNQYWKYNEQTQRAYTYRYPRDIQKVWKFPGNISAAVRWLNGRNYVFWDTTYAKMDKGKVGRARGYPQLISNRWMRCNAKGRDLISDP